MAPIVSFKAGRANRRGDTNFVDPVAAKGLIYLQEEDGLLHFCYKDLTTNAVDDLIIFPGDATFTAVAPRVNVLKFASSSHRHFFWNQDLDATKDEELRKKVNELMSGEEEEEAAPEDHMEVEASTLSANPIASTSSTTVLEASSQTSRSISSSPATSLGTTAQMAQLQSILAGMSSGQSFATSSANQRPQYLLNDVLSPTLLSPLLSNSLSSHIPFLPSALPPTHSTLSRVVHSREFKRSVASLDRALRTGALGPLVAGLGLDPSSAESVDAFLAAIQKQADGEKRESGSTGTGDASQDEKMETD